MYHGEWDKLVEIDQMNRMAQTLRDNHRPVETHSVPYMGHIMVYLFSQQSVDLGIEFLKKQMAAHKL
jgi:predicted esterase